MSPHSARSRRLRTRAATGQVTTIELFFDLVFVFVITQVTHHIEAHPGWEGLLQALLPLAVVWWMFLAFSWLTNAVRPDATAIRLLLVLAMMAFFIMGLDLPFAFDTDGLAFPLAYLAAVAIHCLLFLTAERASARTAIMRTVPYNAGAGLLVLIAPYLPQPLTWLCWAAAVLLLYLLSPLLGGVRGFAIEPHHFVERHGLITILVLGESIVAIGIGAQGAAVGPTLALGVVLGIAVAAGIWWIYFDGDDTRATTALEGAPERRRELLAIYPFGLGHLIMVTGIVLVAAGITDAVHHFNHHTNNWWLGYGTAIFLLGHAAYRAMLGTGPTAERLIGAAVAVPLGWATSFAGWAATAAMALLLAAIATADHFHMRPAPHSRDAVQGDK
ncbi:low temperature requirement protein A [Streptomyces sp. NPDC056921]|uniref:low temperature requirement protein A n=1 Tax=Streptomyces sp. NPDC056921 TaxID=3345966 RepID=UPI00362817B0